MRLFLVVLLAACHGPSPSTRGAGSAAPLVATEREASSPGQAAVAPAAAPSAAAATGLAPLTGKEPFVTLPVAGFGDAVVSLPLGATEPRAIALALHGNFDRPEWQCQVWRGITQGGVFVLCPRGVARTDVPRELDRWEWGSLAKTRAEVLAALGALRARYPEHAAPGPIVFTGFSLGAILGARLLEDRELDIGAAVLVEGGYKGWTTAKAEKLKPTLRRVLFACGQTDCRNAYRYQLGPLLEKAELSGAMVADVKAGHTYDGPVAALIAQEWPALLASLK